MLTLIKIIHTLIWAFMASCVLYVLYCGIARRSDGWLWFSIGIVLFEGVVLAVNRIACPLTNIARRYTDRREDNFDIYLPNWLARHNKTIFFTLFVIGLALVIINSIQSGVS